MKRARDNNVTRFLDIEAQVDNDEEEEIEDDIDNDGFLQLNSVAEEYHPCKRFTDMVEDNSWDDVISNVEKRYALRSTLSSEQCPVEVDPTIVSIVENVSRSPSLHDTPLWRVRCRIGLEEDIIFYLFQKVVPSHELRAAFMRDSIRGWIYLEATMNMDLRQLLRCTPGVFLRDYDIIHRSIEYKEWTSPLTMESATKSTKSLKVGDWVDIRKGVYKGDVGYVKIVESWGIQVLLVPRLPPPQSSNITHSKRKRTCPPATPALFDPLAIKQACSMELSHIRGDLYSFRGNQFEHGLVIKSYNFSSISKIHQIPLSLFSLFRESLHPEINKSSFPRPLEWEFFEGDEVYVRPRFASCYLDWKEWPHGIITSIVADNVRVDLSNDKGIIDASWSDIRKRLNIGDYVEITVGAHRGKTGWLNGDSGWPFPGKTTVIEHVASENAVENQIKFLEVHINSLKRIAQPFEFGKQSTDVQKMRSDRVPWLKTEIIIVGRLTYKTYRGIVVDVHCNQSTSSGLCVQIELMVYDPTAPFKHLRLDYDDVVEARTGLKLNDYAPTMNTLFIPRNRGAQPSRPFRPLTPEVSPDRSDSTVGYATPMPELPYSSSPAWNPSHTLPPDNEPALEGPSRLPVTHEGGEQPKHVLLDSRLIGAQLKVVVNGGSYKQKTLTASIESVNERLIIHWKSYKSWKQLQPEWVTPKHPGLRHNGLLIVISGDHCGKYVRRIYHRYEGEKLVIILGVVNRLAGHLDTLLDERLYLEPSALCLCEEEKEDKDRNESLMNAVRTEACKIRAK